MNNNSLSYKDDNSKRKKSRLSSRKGITKGQESSGMGERDWNGDKLTASCFAVTKKEDQVGKCDLFITGQLILLPSFCGVTSLDWRWASQHHSRHFGLKAHNIHYERLKIQWMRWQWKSCLCQEEKEETQGDILTNTLFHYSNSALQIRKETHVSTIATHFPPISRI